MDDLTIWKERMQQQEKLASLGVLSAGIAHEIQNPLNFVINFSKMSKKLLSDLNDIVQTPPEEMTDDDRDDLADITADINDNLQKIQEHGERAISIIQGILLYSRGKEGERIPTDIANLVKEYLWLGYHAMRAAQKGFNVAIHEKYQEGIKQVSIVPQDISRAILNLVNNAFYAVSKKAKETNSQAYTPELTVEVSEQDGSIIITIEDNGVGMNDEVKQRLYDAFFTTKPAGQGTGLGMGIVTDIIENVHRGSLTFDSEEGKGTKFTITLPC